MGSGCGKKKYVKAEQENVEQENVEGKKAEQEKAEQKKIARLNDEAHLKEEENRRRKKEEEKQALEEEDDKQTRSTLASHETLLTEPLELKEATLPVWIKLTKRTEVFSQPYPHFNHFFSVNHFLPGAVCWAVRSAEGFVKPGMESTLFWQLVQTDGKAQGFIRPDASQLSNSIVAITGRIPPDAVLNLMPEPERFYVFTLKQEIGSSAAVVYNPAGEVVLQIDQTETSVKEIRQKLASQLKVSRKPVKVVGEDAQIFVDDALVGKVMAAGAVAGATS